MSIRTQDVFYKHPVQLPGTKGKFTTGGIRWGRSPEGHWRKQQDGENNPRKQPDDAGGEEMMPDSQYPTLAQCPAAADSAGARQI
jgi:hypothetical protein